LGGGAIPCLLICPDYFTSAILHQAYTVKTIPTYAQAAGSSPRSMGKKARRTSATEVAKEGDKGI